MSLEEINRRLDRIEQIMNRLNEELGSLREEIGVLKGKTEAESNLIKWVIFPLLIILAGLIGIKLVLPG